MKYLHEASRRARILLGVIRRLRSLLHVGFNPKREAQNTFGNRIYSDEDIVWLIMKIIRLCIENSDWVCIINPQTKRGTEELYMVFKLLKRRYRSTDTDEKLRRLEYFNQPFEEDSEIRLVDDFYMDEPVAITSLSTEFDPIENNNKRGSSNAVQRDVKKKDDKKKSKEMKNGDHVADIFDSFEEDQFDRTMV